MVENFAESPGMCSDGPGRAPREIPKRGAITLRESKRREEEANCLRWGKGEGLVDFIPRSWDPPARDTGGQSATPPRTVREARGRSGPQARTVR
jgi:hypothetical protein